MKISFKKKYFKVSRGFLMMLTVLNLGVGLVVGSMITNRAGQEVETNGLTISYQEQFLTVDADASTETLIKSYANNIIIMYNGEVVDTSNGFISDSTYFFDGGHISTFERYGIVDINVTYGHDTAYTWFSVRR